MNCKKCSKKIAVQKDIFGIAEKQSLNDFKCAVCKDYFCKDHIHTKIITNSRKRICDKCAKKIK